MPRHHCNDCALFSALHPTRGYRCRVYPDSWRQGDPIGPLVVPAPARTPAAATPSAAAPSAAAPVLSGTASAAIVAPAPAVKEGDGENEEKKDGEDDKVVTKKKVEEA
ncbi:hypothetical protein BLS_008030 [Venturia inaequalis]|nr:hypothetical protein BLS_008030 [Venturia inaequalis]KAE9989863.1 hypothetical protein EG327_002165 [Venturia inaequalis]RDI87497.1 hypothetical protein Vi05172_g2208 [Venturia inaequalis]